MQVQENLFKDSGEEYLPMIANLFLPFVFIVPTVRRPSHILVGTGALERVGEIGDKTKAQAGAALHLDGDPEKCTSQCHHRLDIK